jgi:surfactin synthase thioesterase subunit
MYVIKKTGENKFLRGTHNPKFSKVARLFESEQQATDYLNIICNQVGGYNAKAEDVLMETNTQLVKVDFTLIEDYSIDIEGNKINCNIQGDSTCLQD